MCFERGVRPVVDSVDPPGDDDPERRRVLDQTVSIVIERREHDVGNIGAPPNAVPSSQNIRGLVVGERESLLDQTTSDRGPKTEMPHRRTSVRLHTSSQLGRDATLAGSVAQRSQYFVEMWAARCDHA